MMDGSKRSYILPMILAFWFSLAFLYTIFADAAGYPTVGHYIISIGQVIFDFAAFWLLLDVVRQSKKEFKFTPFCFMLAMLFLVLSDFFYHGLNSVHWFSFAASTQYLYYDISLTAFFAFMLLGFGRMVAMHKLDNGSSGLFIFLIIVSAILLIWMFFHSTTAKVPHFSVVGVYYSAQTILQALGIAFSLMAMARVTQACLKLLIGGYLMLVVADLVINIRAEQMMSASASVEFVWMLGSMLIAVGAYQRVKELAVENA